MKKYILVILFMSLFFNVFGVSIADESKPIKWQSYQQGLVTAKETNKLIFLNFYAKWCGYCRQMETTTFTDKAVVNYIQDNFVPVFIDSDQEPSISRLYGVNGLPYFWFLKSDGQRIVNIPGYIPSDRFLSILKFIHTESYLKMNFNEFLKKNNQ